MIDTRGTRAEICGRTNMAGFTPRAAAWLLLPLLLLSPSPSEPVAAAAAAVPYLRARRRYDSIFGFGDSFTDTGNNPVVFAWNSVFDPVTRPPYGDTFFGRPTGRNCDGRLIIDFIAQGLGLPLVPPFLAHNGSFRRGANFAVGAATAIDAAFFHDGEPPVDDKDKVPFNTSLGVQMQWFESLKPSLCATTQECKDFFTKSLFFLGEIGFNDYSFLMNKGKNVQQLRSLVPRVIRIISMAIERLIKHGATSLLVSGMVPAGCDPPILTFFPSADQASYDARTGCLKDTNELSTYHNSMLLESLDKIRSEHPDVEITYADFFSPVMEMVKSPAKFGFEEDALTVCCGGPGRYHFNGVVVCGDPGSSTCKDPSARLFWDGAHLTEAANRYIADGWLRSITSPSDEFLQY